MDPISDLAHILDIADLSLGLYPGRCVQYSGKLQGKLPRRNKMETTKMHSSRLGLAFCVPYCVYFPAFPEKGPKIRDGKELSSTGYLISIWTL